MFFKVVWRPVDINYIITDTLMIKSLSKSGEQCVDLLSKAAQTACKACASLC